MQLALVEAGRQEWMTSSWQSDYYFYQVALCLPVELCELFRYSPVQPPTEQGRPRVYIDLTDVKAKVTAKPVQPGGENKLAVRTDRCVMISYEDDSSSHAPMLSTRQRVHVILLDKLCFKGWQEKCIPLQTPWSWCSLLRHQPNMSAVQDSGEGGQQQAYLHAAPACSLFWCLTSSSHCHRPIGSRAVQR